jgi:hypothetical protein
LTELVYARVREEDLGDRMLDSIDPRYARRALSRRGKQKLVSTLKCLPEPKARAVLHTVNGTSRTLDQWAKAHGIPKSTLYSRVVERGMTMVDALKLGSRNEAAAAFELPSQSSDSDHCRTFAADKTNRDGLIGQNLSDAEAAPSKKTPRKAGFEGAQGRNRTADTRIFNGLRIHHK